MSSPGVRMVGVYFPGNGKFYAMGGRAFDGGGAQLPSDFVIGVESAGKEAREVHADSF